MKTNQQITEKDRGKLTAALERQGLRPTRQREHVFQVLLAQRDHPTADEIYARARATLPSISLATVYNCLEALVECDLVKRLNYEREPSRFCPNHGEHAHFRDERTGRVYDIDIPKSLLNVLKEMLPDRFTPNKIKLSFSGTVVESGEEEGSDDPLTAAPLPHHAPKPTAASTSISTSKQKSTL